LTVFLLLFSAGLSLPLPAQETLGRIDTRRTAGNIFALSLLTALPILVFATADARPGLRTENTAIGVVISIPVLVAWPLLISEIHRARKAAVPRTPAEGP
jgi:hypothetical protein